MGFLFLRSFERTSRLFYTTDWDRTHSACFAVAESIRVIYSSSAASDGVGFPG